MSYCKYISTRKVEHLRSVPNVWNPSDATLKAYAEANGYKKYNSGTPENWLCTEVIYRETAKNVYQEFAAPSMGICRARVTKLIEEETERVLASRRMVEYNGNVYIADIQAEINLLGASAIGAPETEWTLADGSTVMLAPEDLHGLATVFALAKDAVYKWGRERSKRVDACESVEDLAAIVTTYQGGEL